MTFLQNKSVKTPPPKLSMPKGSSAFNSPIARNLNVSDNGFIDTHIIDVQSIKLNDVSQKMIERVSAMNISSEGFEATSGSPLSNDDTLEFVISTPSSNKYNSFQNKRKMTCIDTSSFVHTPTTVKDVLNLSPPLFTAQGTKKQYGVYDSHIDSSRMSSTYSNKRQRRSIMPIRPITGGNRNGLSHFLENPLACDNNQYLSSNPTLPFLDDDPIIYSPKRLAAKRWKTLSASRIGSFKPISLSPSTVLQDNNILGIDMKVKNDNSKNMILTSPNSFSEPKKVNLKSDSFVAVVSDSSRSSTPESFEPQVTLIDLKRPDKNDSTPSQGKYFGLNFFDKATMCRFPRHRMMRSQRSDRQRPVSKPTPNSSAKSTPQKDLDILQL